MDYTALAKEFPPIEWEWRVDQADITNGKPWCRVVPYIQNRAIQNRLDEVCGPENWRNDFREWKMKGQLCGISIYDTTKGEWITKWDGADDTDFQSTKGGLSSSMKRAAVQWGIGRHLYELDAVYVDCSLERKAGWEYTKTKDKTPVYWNPKDKKLMGAPVIGNDEQGTATEDKVAAEKKRLTALRDEYTDVLRKIYGKACNVQEHYLKAHKHSIYEASEKELASAIEKAKIALAKKDPTA